MYARLNSEGTEVIVLKTRAVESGKIQGARGPRKIYTNTTEEVTRWDLQIGPCALQMALMGKDAEAIASWARQQNEAINAAFARNIEAGLAGGKPVIAGTKAHKQAKDIGLEGLDESAKLGEFSGVISGVRSISGYASASKPKVAGTLAEEQENTGPMTPVAVARGLRKLAQSLIHGLENRVDQGDSITDEEAFAIYEAERQIYYVLTRGLGIRAKELEAARRAAADRRFSELKRGRNGAALRQAASIRQGL